MGEKNTKIETGDIAERKQHHIDLALDAGSQVGIEPFADVKLPYMALPELDLAEVDTGAELLGKKLTQPLIIASMTGGTKHARTINENLAIAAEETGVAIGLGSQRIALELADARASFEIARKKAPTAVIFANMGAVQLNYGRGNDDYQRVVDMVEADALYLHLNPLQEAMQPEGDTDFRNLLEKIAELTEKLSVPVFAKEVGHGISEDTAMSLIDAGVKGIDAAGVGGTSWAWIEAKRDSNISGKLFQEWFADYGYTTSEAVANISSAIAKAEEKNVKNKNAAIVSCVASGGVRSPLQGLKALISGADYYSAARPFLETALESPEKTVELIQTWQKGLQIAMFSAGLPSYAQIAA